MEIVSILSSTLVLFGAIIMAISLIRYLPNFRNNQPRDRATRRVCLAFIFLMLFFIAGYLAVFSMFVMGISFGGEIIVATIFLFGAVFTVLSLQVLTNMMLHVKKWNLSTVKVLISAIEARDPYTKGHSEHVANLTILIWNNLPSEIRENISYDMVLHAGLLHDIGKIGVPEAILHKPDRLTDEEMSVMKKHPRIGASILSHVETLSDLGDWILYHHERMDGRGYEGLKGKDIPTISRVMAIADTYSALTTDRPYRPGKSHSEAAAIIRDSTGTQFDPILVETFLNIEKEIMDLCKPEVLDVDFSDKMKSIESYVKNYKTGNLAEVVNRPMGRYLVDRLIASSRKKGFKLTLCTLNLKDIDEIDRTYGYHEADQLSREVGETLKDILRSSDSITTLSRGRFMLLLPPAEKITQENYWKEPSLQFGTCHFSKRNSITLP